MNVKDDKPLSKEELAEEARAGIEEAYRDYLRQHGLDAKPKVRLAFLLEALLAVEEDPPGNRDVESTMTVYIEDQIEKIKNQLESGSAQEEN